MLTLVKEAVILWKSRSLVGVLTRRELEARNAGSAGGIFWAYVQPLLTVAAYYLVFDVVFAMRLGENAPTRAVGAFLIVGSLPWMAFCDAVSRGMNSLIDAGSVLQKNALPPVLFPVRSVLASTVIYGPLIALLTLAYGPQHGFGAALFCMVPLLALQLLLCMLIGYLLSVLAAALRDTMQIVGFLLSVGIFLSPVLFPITLFPEQWRWALWLNPMTGMVIGYQEVLLRGAWPPYSVWLSAGVWLVLTSIVLSVVVRRSRDQLVDWL